MTRSESEKPKISPGFAARLKRLGAREKVHAIVLLRADDAGETVGKRQSRAEREAAVEAMRSSARQKLAELDAILDRFDGKNITWAISECLLVDGPRVIVTPGGAKGMMAALDKTDGKTLWTSPLTAMTAKPPETAPESPITLQLTAAATDAGGSAVSSAKIRLSVGPANISMPTRPRR